MHHFLLLLLSLLLVTSQSWCFKTAITDTDKIRCLDYSDDGRYLAVGCESQITTFYDSYELVPLGTYQFNGQKPNKIKFSPDGNYAAICYDHDDVKIISTATWTLHHTLDTDQGKVYQIDFSEDSSKLVSCGDDDEFKIWETTTWGSVPGGFDVNEKATSCKFTSDDSIVVGDQNGDVIFVSVADYTTGNSVNYGSNVGEVSVRYGTHTYIVADRNSKGYTSLSTTQISDANNDLRTADYARTLDYFVMAGNFKQAYLFNATNQNNSLVMTFAEPTGHIRASRFTNDGQYLAIGSEDDSVYIYHKNCIQCQAGQYYNQVSQACEQCHTFITGCGACTSTTCHYCLQNYYLSSNQCLLCSSALTGCYTCNSSSVCMSCIPGFYLKADNTCEQCSTPMAGCISCTGPAYCTECSNDYYLTVSNLCSPCTGISNCLLCDSSTVCLTCVSGYYLTGASTCDLCPNAMNNCLFCTSQTQCVECSLGYVVAADSQSCSLCSDLMAGCISCSALATCTQCQDGYKLNAGSCQQCGFGCSSCDASNCLECLPSFWLNSGSCTLCQTTIDGCYACADNTNCLSCSVNYYLSGGSCLLCKDTLAGCQICSDASTCLSCLSGYYLNAGGCNQCSSIQGCQICSDATTCLQCENGYYLQGGNCLPCTNTLSGCLYCSDNANCQECKSGYFLNGSSQCQFCHNQMEGCIFCSSNTVCVQCEGGYYLNSVTFVCDRCTQLGCEVCQQTSPAQCVSCNSKYYLNANSCLYCRDAIAGCIECSDSSTCTECDVGYYVNGGSCSLCSDVMSGCSICSSNSVCLECKSMYFLNSSSNCQLCSTAMDGCAFCVNSGSCLSCQSTYFLNSSSLCQHCTSITGCIACQSSTQCLLCSNEYYHSGSSCHLCSTQIQGCYSCISNSVCSACSSGYTLNSAFGCDQVTVQAQKSVTDIFLKSFYIDKDNLRHSLYITGMSYTKQDLDWQTQSRLFLKKTDNTEISLTIKEVRWTDNDYQLQFYTDNPTNLDASSISFMTFTRRLQASINTGFKIDIVLTEQAMGTILPSYSHSGQLALEYNINQPQFYASYVRNVNFFSYHLIGIIIVGIMFVVYSIKPCVVQNSLDYGQVIPHILSMKVGALILFPTYVEYIDYASGFMSADLPYLNHYFGSVLSDSSETVPLPYSVFYINMNLASQYILPLCVCVLLIIIALLVGKSCEADKPMYNYLSFLYMFFVFGLSFMGCACLQGAILNPITTININGLFYILGILIYICLCAETVYRLLFRDAKEYIHRVRIILKATILSLSHFSPVYLVASCVVADTLLAIGQFIYFKAKHHHYPKIWLTNQILLNAALTLIVYVPNFIIVMVISSVLIGLVLLLDLFFICKEYSGEEKVTKIETEEKNVWDIKITNDQELKESNNETFYTMKIDFDEPIRKKKAKQLKKSKRLDILRKEEEDNGQFAYEETIQ